MRSSPEGEPTLSPGPSAWRRRSPGAPPKGEPRINEEKEFYL
nr:MAG TPA: hypothetical protein [Caudoviricetes sp.]